MRVLELTAHVQKISRGKGRSATAAAAYRAACAIVCEREGRTHDYTRKTGIEASAIVLPSRAPSWAQDRAKLWNAAELRERNGARGKNAGKFKADAVTAREFLFAFPAELSAAGRQRVTEAIARQLIDAHGIAADYSIHAPGKEGDQRNYHCHLMATTRRFTATGLGEKAREWDDLHQGPALVKQWRAFVAGAMNAELAAEGKAALVHVEHRSFEERGGGVKPTQHQGARNTNRERKVRQRVRDTWRTDARQRQDRRHAEERAALKTRHDFARAAKMGDIAQRERAGIAAIRADQAVQQAADTAPKGMNRLFQIVTGRAMRADFERQSRAAERDATADRAVDALKAGAEAERTGFAAAQVKETAALASRHKTEDQQFRQAVTARTEFDRVAEVQGRRDQVPGRGHDRHQARDVGPGLSPS